MTTPLRHKCQVRIRDVFLFSSFTGLSHADIMKLTHADIHTDDNGNRAAQ